MRASSPVARLLSPLGARDPFALAGMLSGLDALEVPIGEAAREAPAEALVDPDDAGVAVNRDLHPRLERSHHVDPADGGLAVLARAQRAVLQRAANLEDDGRGARKHRRPRRVGDDGDEHLARRDRVGGAGADTHAPARNAGRDRRPDESAGLPFDEVRLEDPAARVDEHGAALCALGARVGRPVRRDGRPQVEAALLDGRVELLHRDVEDISLRLEPAGGEEVRLRLEQRRAESGGDAGHAQLGRVPDPHQMVEVEVPLLEVGAGAARKEAARAAFAALLLRAHHAAPTGDALLQNVGWVADAAAAVVAQLGDEEVRRVRVAGRAHKQLVGAVPAVLAHEGDPRPDEGRGQVGLAARHVGEDPTRQRGEALLTVLCPDRGRQQVREVVHLHVHLHERVLLEAAAQGVRLLPLLRRPPLDARRVERLEDGDDHLHHRHLELEHGVDGGEQLGVEGLEACRGDAALLERLQRLRAAARLGDVLRLGLEWRALPARAELVLPPHRHLAQQPPHASKAEAGGKPRALVPGGVAVVPAQDGRQVHVHHLELAREPARPDEAEGVGHVDVLARLAVEEDLLRVGGDARARQAEEGERHVRVDREVEASEGRGGRRLARDVEVVVQPARLARRRDHRLVERVQRRDWPCLQEPQLARLRVRPLGVHRPSVRAFDGGDERSQLPQLLV
mmetsp:Transcript_19462/g.64294  ORF Transcript_19462/g.64294 Transcript_19462/m.64294 type:complete len:681 (+) Transcript_19462:639-2681(+)